MKRKFPAFVALALVMSCFAAPASALEYNYESDAPGQNFYNPTTVDSNYIENSDTIIVGTDGTIVTETSGLATSSPLSVLDNIPVGDYPDAWGPATDVAIAQNSVFPNFLAPTTQQSNVNNFLAYDNIVISSGALPKASELLTIPHGLLPTANYAMPQMTTDGAIGTLSIGAIGLYSYIYEGTTQANMAKGVAHFPSTMGWNGNIGLAGHNRSASGHAFFGKLKDLQIGDVVTYTTLYGTRNYVVSDISYCATTDTSGLLQDGTNKLTMYTCKANDPSVKLRVTAVETV